MSRGWGWGGGGGEGGVFGIWSVCVWVQSFVGSVTCSACFEESYE